jgi:hypothetical protein
MCHLLGNHQFVMLAAPSQGLHGNGRPLSALRSLRLCLDELSAADAAVLGLCSCPALTLLQLDSNGSNIGMTGAQGLAPLTQLQQLIVPTQSLGDEGLRVRKRSSRDAAAAAAASIPAWQAGCEADMNNLLLV